MNSADSVGKDGAVSDMPAGMAHSRCRKATVSAWRFMGDFGVSCMTLGPGLPGTHAPACPVCTLGAWPPPGGPLTPAGKAGAAQPV